MAPAAPVEGSSARRSALADFETALTRRERPSLLRLPWFVPTLRASAFRVANLKVAKDFRKRDIGFVPLYFWCFVSPILLAAD
jgi:hypothetical protein